MKIIKVRILCDGHIVKKVSKFFHISQEYFIHQYLPSKYKYKIVNKDDIADICIINHEHIDNKLLRLNEINILLCVENLLAANRIYPHYNKYGNYGNRMINVYIYNHITKSVNDSSIAIPDIYFRCNYFIKYFQNCIKEKISKKKFCLFVSRNRMNVKKNNIIKQLEKYKKIDYISEYDNIIKNSSCYYSKDLLHIFSQYKFIIVFENSVTDGYITEKIFNVFASGSIPIYNGAPNITDFINPKSFILYQNHINDIIELDNNYDKYIKMLHCEKISYKPDNILETYLDSFIELDYF
jgi:hypothetical protein